MRVVKSNENKIKEGYGQGLGPKYKPWFTVREVPSKGRATRVWGWKSDRVHVLLSDNERNLLYNLLWLDAVVDIKEQFPLPLAITTDIAACLGIRHPKITKTDPKTRKRISALVVMTTDFVVSLIDGRTIACTCKPQKELDNPKRARRILEKFQIEKQYWKSQGVKFRIVTDAAIPQVLVRNIRFIRDAYLLEGVTGLPCEEDVKYIESVFREKLSQGALPKDVAKWLDMRLSLETGTSTFLFRHFLATRRLLVDMNTPIAMNKPVKLGGGSQWFF